MHTLTIPATQIETGDRILSWTSESGETIDVRDDTRGWDVDGIIHRPEDAPSYRRHRHGQVQVLFRHGRIDLDENLPVTVLR